MMLLAPPCVNWLRMNPAGSSVSAQRDLGERFFYAAGAADLLFTENESNRERLWGAPNPSPYVKDGINNFLVHGNKDAVNPEQTRDESRRPLPTHAGGGGKPHDSPAPQRPADR